MTIASIHNNSASMLHRTKFSIKIYPSLFPPPKVTVYYFPFFSHKIISKT